MDTCGRARWPTRSAPPAPICGSCAGTARRSSPISPTIEHINLSYYRDGNREWISVSGTAVISRDRAKIAELYAPDWSMWFDKEGDPRNGTPDDPRIVLIGVTVHAAEFLDVKAKPVVLFELVKGWVTGTEPEMGEMHKLVEPRRP